MRRRPLLALLAVLIACLGILVARTQLSDAGYVASQTLSANSVATSYYFTCQAAVMGDGSSTEAGGAWALNESTGSTAADSTGNGNTGVYVGGVAKGNASTVCPRDSNNAVVKLDGSSGYIVSSWSYPSTTTFTEEIWFRTNTAGGRLMGFGNSGSIIGGTSVTYDRQVYFDDSGNLCFGVYTGSRVSICAPPSSSSTGSFTDNAWHYVAASLTSSGMVLYIDGRQVASGTSGTSNNLGFSLSGYWRVGFDSLGGWVSYSNYHFAGYVARFAVYGYGLSASQVAAHYRAGQAS